jgi:hypothetical protein
MLALTIVIGCSDTPATTANKNTPSPAPAVGSNNEKLFGSDLIVSDDSAIETEPASTPVKTGVLFTEVAQESGLDFVYQNGEAGQSLMVEAVGGGVGVLDYDRNGKPDLLFSQGGDPTEQSNQSRPHAALFRNDGGSHSNGNMPFQNVALAAGIGAYGYGQGVAVGDFNADGFDDVYLTNVGQNTLLQNMGDGTFRDVTETVGLSGETLWSTSAAFADLNDDGLLDLFVCNYVAYDPLQPLICRNSQGEPRICHPREMQPLPNHCYLNDAQGGFLEVAADRGLRGPGSKSLGVVVADFDVDGIVDVYVANDTTANFLFTGTPNGGFLERGLQLGCAANYEGLMQASMGLAIGDYDHDGYLDIYSTHYYEESNTLYRNLGKTGFQDVTGRVGLHTPTLQSLGFGTVMQDFDCDGQEDLFITNGHVENYPDNPILKMPPQFFQFDGRRWHETSLRVGDFFQSEYIGRGVVKLDFDDDGDMDLLVVHQNAPAALLRNDSERGVWLKLSFVGRLSPRSGAGCRVRVEAGEKIYTQELVGGGSYLSSHEQSLVFGLGDHQGSCRVSFDWSDGTSQVIENVECNKHHVVEQ